MNEIGTVVTIEGTLRISVGPGLLYHRVAVIEAAPDGEPFKEVGRLTADQLRLVLLYGGQALREIEARCPRAVAADLLSEVHL